MTAEVHWHEGLFLLPHHLQRLQRGWHDLAQAERRLICAYPYGVIDARLARDELENFRVWFDRLRVIMPSGVWIDFDAEAGGNTDLQPIDIRTAFAKSGGALLIQLAVPLWQEGRPNVVDRGQPFDDRTKHLYCLKEREFRDENTGENPQPIPTRLINARLLVNGEDHQGLEVLPLLRVVRATGDQVGMPRLDSEFAPPCLLIHGSPVLRDLVRDLIAQLEASRKELALKLAQGGFNIELIRGVQIAQLLRLQTLNRFAARLPSLWEAPALTPFAMYMELRSLLAELLALHPERDDFEAAPYDHNLPYPAFRELTGRIRDHLRLEGGRSYLSVPFEDVNGILTANLTDEHFSTPHQYYLAVSSQQDPTELARFVEDGNKFKLMPASMARAAKFGISLKGERYPPLELPTATDLHYFRLDCAMSKDRWEQARQEKSLVLIGADREAVAFRLFMTLPGGVKP
jgi:type VI secretion system protein ImpJ